MPPKTDALAKRAIQYRLGQIGLLGKTKTKWEPWKPEAEPQLEAYNSLADIIGYGGSAGGGGICGSNPLPAISCHCKHKAAPSLKL